MTDEELKEIEERAGAASPTPWLWSEQRQCVDTGQIAADGTIWDLYEIVPNNYVPDEQWKADATFIARARTDVPTLCAEVRRLSRILEHEECDRKRAEAEVSRLLSRSYKDALLIEKLMENVDKAEDERDALRKVVLSLVDYNTYGPSNRPRYELADIVAMARNTLKKWV